MLLAFELSGEHGTIPYSEVIACLESLKVDFSIHLRLDGCLIVELRGDAGRIADILSGRLAMTHHIIKVLGISGMSEEEILDMVGRADFEFEGTYSVRVRRIKQYSDINTEIMEKRIGGIFYHRGARADLRNPDIRFRVLLTEKSCIFGEILSSINRSDFESRKPHHKPFFYPGVLMPRVARALVNMAKPGECLLDPFCGTGGILVEAGLIGINVIGGDVQRKLLSGAKTNLQHYKARYFLMYQDACKMALRDGSVDAVVTDPPYGRSAAIKARSLDHLLECSLNEIYRVLKNGKRAVFISEREIGLFAEKTGFRKVESHLQRVHRSLTRRIYVLEKSL